MVFCSWSGGKDSCLALYYALKEVGKVDILFTMLDENCERTRAHGLKKELILRQAESLGILSETRCASWETYEEVFTNFLLEKVKNGVGVFGDIDLQEHLDWVERVCSKANVKVIEPLWKRDREELVRIFISLGFKAKIVATSKKFPGTENLIGKELSEELFPEMESLGIDKCGENGEFHTFVYDGPIFKKPVKFEVGQVIETDKSYILDIF